MTPLAPTRLLMLHRVMPEETTAFGRPSCYRLRGTALTLEELDRVLDAGTFLALEDVLGALAAGEPPPPGWVLTFDDGYREWLEQVAPRLEARRIRAAFFVCPAFLASATRPHPVDAFYWLLDHARRSRFSLHLPDGTGEEGSLESDEGKASLVRGRVKQFVVKGPREQVGDVLSRLARVLDTELPEALAPRLHLSEREVEALARAGHLLGGHGLSHRHLSAMEPGEAEREIRASLDWVCRLSGQRAAPFAYPDGALDERTARLVEAAGATGALTCRPGPVLRDSLRFELPREFVTPHHPLVRPESTHP